MKQQIKHWSGRVLFECDVPDTIASGLAMRHALEKAVSGGCDLSGSDLSGSDLSGSNLRGSDLSDSDLSGSNLRGSDLSDSDLSGSNLRDSNLSGSDGNPLPRATSKQAIENLDKVREIVLDNEARLNMNHWHGSNSWTTRTCAEETLCGTTHCMAGWLQVCTTEPALKNISAQLAGILAAPIAAKMFYSSTEQAVAWLRDRKYVAETQEYERRISDINDRPAS